MINIEMSKTECIEVEVAIRRAIGDYEATVKRDGEEAAADEAYWAYELRNVLDRIANELEVGATR